MQRQARTIYSSSCPQNFKDYKRQAPALHVVQGDCLNVPLNQAYSRKDPQLNAKTGKNYIYSCSQNFKDFYPQEASLIIAMSFKENVT